VKERVGDGYGPVPSGIRLGLPGLSASLDNLEEASWRMRENRFLSGFVTTTLELMPLA
jgi:hypothetical protein